MTTVPAPEPAFEQQEQIAIQLSNIFLPTAARKRQAIRDRGGYFVHYTNAAAALGIISSKRIWMRNAKCMADFNDWCAAKPSGYTQNVTVAAEPNCSMVDIK